MVTTKDRRNLTATATAEKFGGDIPFTPVINATGSATSVCRGDAPTYFTQTASLPHYLPICMHICTLFLARMWM